MITITSESSPSSQSGSMDTDESSPTVHMGQMSHLSVDAKQSQPQRIGLLRRLSAGAASESEEEGTPTKNGGERANLSGEWCVLKGEGVEADIPGSHTVSTPTPSPKTSAQVARMPPTLHPVSNTAVHRLPSGNVMPRLSLPAIANPKVHRTLHHRQSHPAPATYQQDEEDVFEAKFITLETLGKGAFSTVVKVQERYGDGIFAVKKARGVFDGVKDR
jgi:mitosis inhibitor protein kinase SWE1